MMPLHPQTGSTPRLRNLLSWILILAAGCLHAQYCTMVCNDQVNVSLDASCEAEVTYDMILQSPDNPQLCSPNGFQAFTVFVYDKAGQLLPTSPFVPKSYIGQNLTVKVKHKLTGNTCWGKALIEDKMPPTMSGPGDVTIACTQSTDTATTGKPVVKDCSKFNLIYTDQEFNLGCNDPSYKIKRTFIATDEYGNKRTCVQQIFIRRAKISDVTFPPNLDNISAPAIPCTQPDTTPAHTGYPSIKGFPLHAGSHCTLNAAYSDQVIPICPGTFKVLRTWTVLDWCAGTVTSKVQIIKVLDNTAPELVCPDTIWASTTSDKCLAHVYVPPASVDDDCSPYTVSIISNYGQIPANGGVLYNLPLGSTTVTYSAKDACQNISTCQTVIKVQDKTPPVAVCDQFTVVSLSTGGIALVDAQVFDNGSQDNCCLDFFRVKRMGEADSLFRPAILFNCDDAGKDIMVILRVYDCFGNFNDCMVQVNIQDKVAPVLHCPPNLTVDCSADLSNLSLYGTASVISGCSNAQITETVDKQLNACGTGKIIRTFQAQSGGGAVTTCSQVITVTNSKPFTAAQITWPKDLSLSDCLNPNQLTPEDLDPPYDKPVIKDAGCNLIATGHTDEFFSVAPPACFKILRKWVVIDWCVYDPNAANPKGRWEHVQVIKVNDNTAPVLTCPSDVTVLTLEADCKGAQVDLEPAKASDCNPGVVITNSYNSGGANASGFYPLGKTLVSFLAKDGCGNSSTCSVQVTVLDGKKPTPLCFGILSIPLMQNGMVAVWATDFDHGSFDNCTPANQLTYTIKKYEGQPSSGPPDSASVTFTCDDIGTQQVEVWVCDASGNCDYCLANVLITDNSGICKDSSMTQISGLVADPNGKGIEAADIKLMNNGLIVQSDANGAYTFPWNKKGKSYEVKPNREGDPKNGINTFDVILLMRHILGIQNLKDPYRYFAADTWQDGHLSAADVVELRKVILGVQKSFLKSSNWKFFDQAYAFPPGMDPLAAPVPQSHTIVQLDQPAASVNFIGVKTGDLNGDAKLSQFQESEDREEPASLPVRLEFVPSSGNGDLLASLVLAAPAELNALELRCTYDSLNWILESWESPAIPEWDWMWSPAADGSLHVQAVMPQPRYLEAGSVIARARMTPAGPERKEGPALSLEGGSLAYDGQGKIYGLQQRAFGDPAETAAFEFLENVPNPFAQETQIRFRVPEACDYRLRISDSAGREQWQHRAAAGKGLNTYRLDAEAAGLVPGLYFCEIFTPFGQACRKLMLAR